LNEAVTVPVAGRYGIWLGGSFRRRLEVDVDGRRLGVARHELAELGVYWEAGDVQLNPGPHTVRLRYSAANLSPGSGGRPFGLGPLILSRSTPELRVMTVQPADAAALCGTSLD